MFGTTSAEYRIFESVTQSITDTATGSIATIGHLTINLLPILIAVFVLFAVVGFVWYKMKGFGR